MRQETAELLAACPYHHSSLDDTAPEKGMSEREPLRQLN